MFKNSIGPEELLSKDIETYSSLVGGVFVDLDEQGVQRGAIDVQLFVQTIRLLQERIDRAHSLKYTITY